MLLTWSLKCVRDSAACLASATCVCTRVRVCARACVCAFVCVFDTVNLCYPSMFSFGE